ncbi:hypothetical protein BHE74_00053450 [Ensete ventricosum]|nr:hypothetical protein BHE74_00053450 [Ensete ventricosum]
MLVATTLNDGGGYETLNENGTTPYDSSDDNSITRRQLMQDLQYHIIPLDMYQCDRRSVHLVQLGTLVYHVSICSVQIGMYRTDS